MIIAKRIRLILKTGRVVLYSHIEEFKIKDSTLFITAERDGVDTRINVKNERYTAEQLLTMDVEFHVPRT